MCVYMYRCIAALSSAIQHAMPTEIGGKWGMECFNTRSPLPTLLCAGYSVKLKKKNVLLFFCFTLAHSRGRGNLGT